MAPGLVSGRHLQKIPHLRTADIALLFEIISCMPADYMDSRPFAWQEAVLVTAMILQYFDIWSDDPQYSLQIKSTLTIKPEGNFMRAKLRQGWTPAMVERHLSGSVRGEDPSTTELASESPTDESQSSQATRLTVLYGSNSGTCETFAQSLAASAGRHGFRPEVRTLDSAKQNLPANEPIVIVTASYEGVSNDDGQNDALSLWQAVAG